MTAPVLERRSLREAVFGYLCDHPGASCSEIAAGLGVRYDRVRTALETLYNHKKVGGQGPLERLSNQPWRYYPAQYSVAPSSAVPSGASDHQQDSLGG